MLVAATLHVDGQLLPVRIRNMSVSGALIEAATLPPAGAAVVLERGSLQVAGRISWSTGSRKRCLPSRGG